MDVVLAVSQPSVSCRSNVAARSKDGGAQFPGELAVIGHAKVYVKSAQVLNKRCAQHMQFATERPGCMHI